MFRIRTELLSKLGITQIYINQLRVALNVGFGPTPHGPPTGSGGREKWFVDGRRKRETKRFLSAFSQRVPIHVPSPPSRWAGRYGPFAVRAAGRVSRKKYSLPPHNPTREGSPEGRTSSLWGFFPHFFPRNGAPAGQAKVPCRSNGVGKTHNTPNPLKNAPSSLARPERGRIVSS